MKLFEDIGLDKQKSLEILCLLYYSKVRKFENLVELCPFSKGTTSKYLEELLELGLVKKEVNSGRSVNWFITNKGEKICDSQDKVKLVVSPNQALDFKGGSK